MSLNGVAVEKVTSYPNAPLTDILSHIQARLKY